MKDKKKNALVSIRNSNKDQTFYLTFTDTHLFVIKKTRKYNKHVTPKAVFHMPVSVSASENLFTYDMRRNSLRQTRFNAFIRLYDLNYMNNILK